MHCLYFICKRKFDARKNYATLEINLKGEGDKDDGLTPLKNGLALSEQTACVIVQVFLTFRVVLSPRIRRRKPAIKPGGCLDIRELKQQRF